MPTYRRSRGRSRGARPKLTWEQTTIVHNLTAAASAVVTNLTMINLGVGAIQTATVRRMIGSVRLQALDTADAVSYGVGVYVGIGDAITANVPDPLQDLTQDWYWWRAGLEIPVTSGLTGGPGATNPEWEFDIRTMRRIRAGYKLVIVSQNLVNAQAIVADISLRLLWSSP